MKKSVAAAATTTTMSIMIYLTSSRENMHPPNRFLAVHLYVLEYEQDIVRDHVNQAHRQVDFRQVKSHLDV
ncbi:unnamed protein product [Adineta ricciae]|uniref:Uncharacterized protein n=1 Tax=Adineta ricciae TaxID=249248 RepID=A0A814USS9_ADIRI|nr:unnamed protein product [Adineta ricciae]